MVGVMGQANHAAYTATKGGMNALTKSMALDYASFGVRVNAVCPAGVWTPMLRQWASEQPAPPALAVTSMACTH
jgi:NAD(P)-dependent dehydrogenase (short-subunit alcohol dehydrogenase family)